MRIDAALLMGQRLPGDEEEVDGAAKEKEKEKEKERESAGEEELRALRGDPHPHRGSAVTLYGGGGGCKLNSFDRSS